MRIIRLSTPLGKFTSKGKKPPKISKKLSIITRSLRTKGTLRVCIEWVNLWKKGFLISNNTSMDFMQIDRRKLEEEYNFMKKLLAKDTWMLSQTLVLYMKKEY
jgi:hypothetical protein